MNYLRPSSEDEMIAEFLRAEIDSLRFGLNTAEEMVRQAATLDVLRHPDLTDAEQIRKRRAILAATRGWGRNEGSFAGFPAAVTWHLARIEEHDLEHITFDNDRNWSQLSGGAKTPAAVAARINGNQIEEHLMDVPDYEWCIRGIKATSNAISRGDVLPAPIVIRPVDGNRIVIIEGFTRFSALMLAERCVGAVVIVGHTKERHLRRWVGLRDPSESSLPAPRRVVERTFSYLRQRALVSGRVASRSPHGGFADARASRPGERATVARGVMQRSR
jgi:hypothetical protein